MRRFYGRSCTPIRKWRVSLAINELPAASRKVIGLFSLRTRRKVLPLQAPQKTIQADPRPNMSRLYLAKAVAPWHSCHMLDHVSIAVADLARSLEFYARALAPLGIKRLMAYGGTTELPDHVGFGDQNKPFFWIGTGKAVHGYVHVAFGAASPSMVDAFHSAAIKAGGRDNGRPGLRPQYHAGYYGAFVLDPDGVNIEAVHHDFSAFA